MMGKGKEKYKQKLKDILPRRLVTRKNQQLVLSPKPLEDDELRASVATTLAAEIVVKELPSREGEETSTLWEEAVNSLEPEDREKLDVLIKCKRDGQAADPSSLGSSFFDGVDSLTDHVGLVLSRAKKLKDENNKATWSPVLNRIVQGALAIKSLGDTAVKFDKSGYAALSWSVVSFGLQVAANAEKTRDFVLSSSEVVTGLLARYIEYEKWFRGQHAGGEFDRRVMNVYKAILLYVMALDDYLQQCAAEHFVRASIKLDDRSISLRRDAIDNVDTEVRDWLLIIIHKSNEDNFSQLRKVIDQSLPEPSQPTQRCLRSLSFPEMENRSNDIDSAAEGTCKWLLRHKVHRDWAACDRSLLWIKGKPGLGKSTLLRYALGDAIVASNIGDRALVLSFFFHGRGTELQKSSLGFFRSLLHQLLRRVPDALPDLVSTFEERFQSMGEPGQKWQWNLRELQASFKSSLPKVLENHPVWLFVDALDECGEENAINLVDEFKSLLRELPPTDSQFHICFTCRHYPILDLDYGLEICLEHENKEDISSYIEAQFSMQKASMIPAATRKTIMDRASGVFMWARLVIKRVLALERKGMEWEAIEAEIKTIPPELDKLYDELVQGMINQDMIEKSASLKLIQNVGTRKIMYPTTTR
ncbi:hypothetical protein HD806DRAFT_53878 [Xylariaceae sp. AK1471]|nr:hypothetical protein HD806DRAFT_53878 [Xylariaceae sp. AK1471]